MRRNMLILFGFIVVLVTVGCSIITPNPDILITDYDPVGDFLPASESYYQLTEIEIVNQNSVPLYINNYYVEFYHNSTLLYTWPNDGGDLDVYLDGTTDSKTSTAYLYNLPIKVTQEVIDDATANDWEEVECVIYITAEDAHGYGKTTTESFSFSFVR